MTEDNRKDEDQQSEDKSEVSAEENIQGTNAQPEIAKTEQTQVDENSEISASSYSGI